jgi:hypothetical protein
VRRPNYTRELEMLMKLYSDLIDLTLSLDMATLNKLTAGLIPPHRLREMLQEVLVRMEPGYTPLTTI